MDSPLSIIAGVSLLAWLYLAFLHGGFWRADQRMDGYADSLPRSAADWPGVVAVVPARNEAEGIERALRSLLGQDYPGAFALLLVDDQSEDATAEIARELAARHPHGERLEVLRSLDMPEGWVGKMWAVHTGVEAAAERFPEASLLLLTDADVEHDRGSLRRLVCKAENEGFDLVSLMVRLHCRSAWERLLIPAFVYFFQKLYPFARINDPASRTAGAAGGCMLVRREALEAAGGIEAIRDAIIDDCALGKALKQPSGDRRESPANTTCSPRGRVWVGLGATEHSFRPYRGLADIWDMVARSAYTQLRYSPLLLAGTVLGLALLYLVPPLLAIACPLHGDPLASSLALATWLLMAWTYLPTLRDYGLSPLYAFLLPLSGTLYLLMTLDSARRHRAGRGAHWKGRAGAGHVAAAMRPTLTGPAKGASGNHE
ncbi:MAG: glycosyltransferase [Deltaproteobacteria bacterium]|nr:glycosyltransferase [Deltaproteobacteria bacterium]MBW2417803.1 glycosyltransferase [Deltaproteobacteria bacterium]